MSKTFKKGDEVSQLLAGYGETTTEQCTVLRTDKKGVWLDNGPGNNPTGPFDATSGKYLGPSVPGFSMSIQAPAPAITPTARRRKP